MSRLSREKKREDKRAARAAAPVTAPIAVHVPATGAAFGAGAADGTGAPAWASVDGVRIQSAPGEEIQQAVLNHLHRLALATGHPVLATVTDERIGYVVPLQVSGDGSSAFTAEPLRTGPADQVGPAGPAARPAGTVRLRKPAPDAPHPHRQDGPPYEDRATHVLRRVPQPAREPEPPFGPRAVPAARPEGEPAAPAADATPAVPAADATPSVPASDASPGAAAAPLGRFGPPPVMDAASADAGPGQAPGTARAPEPPAVFEPAALPGARPAGPAKALVDPEAYLDLDPDSKPTPPRGFDAVAEAVLGEDPRDAGGPSGVVLLAEPLERVNEAVRAGRIEEAATLASAAVEEASGTLGPDHPEVLRLRELSAYVAYLAGDPLHAFRLSVDLAGVHRRAGDAEGAYGNVLSAATAWRAVRDPEQGLGLGRELIGLWTELAAAGGPAAEDADELESARARMDRLTERARRQATEPKD
ncbi:tetratricopeptide repeat protein [Streptomyces sp. BBFR115]|uniref:tetratricopeptide repeat protein n=1 Tax=Streptomyces sp. BBFR115 TaxID=3448173 RepID=UPI003F75D7E1